MAAFESISRVLNASRSALLLVPGDKLEYSDSLILALLHGVGIAALTYYYHAPLLLTVALAAGAAAFHLLTRYASLTPFFFAYGVLLVRVMFVRILHGTVGGYFDYELPDWPLVFLQVDAATLAAGIYVALIAAAGIVRDKRMTLRLAATAMIALSVVWAALEYGGHRTSGSTGSDPYTYVQMAVDIAQHGTPAHRFEIFPAFASVKIGWFELLHVGYHLPMNTLGDAVSVFPIGGAFSYAVAFRLFGEAALYWVNPAYSLLAVIASGLLAWELTRGRDSAFRLLASAATLAIVATTNQQVVWAGVTMVDAQAEFFSVLSFFFALRTRHDKSAWTLILCGAFLAAAYWVRHTQIVLIPSLVLLLWVFKGSLRERAMALVLCGGTALVLASGDLLYHQFYLGGWLHPESEELALYSAGAIWNSASELYLAAFAANEFGWLTPFMICGALLYLRRIPIEAIALIVWLATTIAFHLPYAAVRLRDLLPEFPALAFLAAFGAVDAASYLLAHARLQWAAGLVLFAGIELGALRVWNTARGVFEPAQPIFGFMSASQRASFTQLEAMTPPNSVIGSTLNDGPIELYSGRRSFRPDGWSSAERRVFLDIERSANAPVYLLQDGAAMDGVLDDLVHDSQIRLITSLDVPLFGDNTSSSPGALWEIEPK